MEKLDFIVMVVFAVSIFIMGLAFAKTGTNVKSYFAAGGHAPWWINGLSLFMSFFSAGTFVVWGSIAYRLGFVAITIQSTMFVAGIIIALFIAPRWKKTNVLTAAEYIGKRLGTKVQQFFTYMFLLLSLILTGQVLYPVGKLVYVATPWSLEACIIGLGVMIIIYTAVGGLWAVLVTDVLQFVILTAAVLIVVPLAFQKIGGIDGLTNNAPEGFFDLIGGEFTWGFIMAFTLYHIVYIGGNWAFVQRYTSVSNEKESRKVAILFAALYSFSPLIWMLPPLIYKVLDPSLTGLEAEGAYLLMCQKVLPAGLMGLMLAGMISATASSANTSLNLIAAVFTNDVFKKLMFPSASHKITMRVARLSTVFFGIITVIIALLVPKIGGIVEVVLSIGAISGGALMAPIIWTLFSKYQTPGSVMTASLVSLGVSLFFKFFTPVMLGIKLTRAEEMITGVGLPLVILAVYELYARSKESVSEAYIKYEKQRVNISNDNSIEEQAAGKAATGYGVRVISIALAYTGCGLLILTFFMSSDDKAIVFIVAGIIILASFLAWRNSRRYGTE